MSINAKIAMAFGAGILLSAGIFAGLAFNNINTSEDLVSVLPDGRLQYKWQVPTLPKKIDFAGEAVPLDKWEVRERLERDLTSNYYAHGSMLVILRLSSRYFPIIQERLAANGIPDDFKYLCVAESSLQHLTSPAGAQSLWQFMPATAAQYGLQVDGEVDERYNVVKATDAACKYFKAAYDKFGSWTAAAASYNCGTGGYNNQSTFQQTKNYYDLLLPEETNRYIFRILAYKQLIGNAAKYGYVLSNDETYKPFATKTVTITESIPNLADYAINNGTTYKMLKVLNPWLKSRTLTVAGNKQYELLLPK